MCSTVFKRVFQSCVVLLASANIAAAQAPSPQIANVAGIWTGTLTQGDRTFAAWFDLKQAGQTISGVARLEFDQRFAELSVSGAANTTSVLIQEIGVQQANGGPFGPGSYWCIKTMHLSLNGNAGLSGPWDAPNCQPGTLQLTRTTGQRSPSDASATALTGTAAADDVPVILKISSILPVARQTITITGHRFGMQPPYTDQDSPHIRIHHAAPAWSAGSTRDDPADQVTLSVASWSDERIVLSGFGGGYGRNDWVLRPGSHLTVEIWNAATDAGPASYDVIVASQQPPAIVITEPPDPMRFAPLPRPARSPHEQPSPVGADQDRASSCSGEAMAATGAKDAYALGMQAANNGDGPTALCWLKLAADKGHTGAPYQIAMVYFDAIGGLKDNAKGLPWLRAGVAAGDPAAEYFLGLMYQLGMNDVPRNYPEATRLYDLAAAAGYPRAQAFRFCNRFDVKKAMVDLTKKCDSNGVLNDMNKEMYQLRLFAEARYDVIEIQTNNSDDTSAFKCHAVISRHIDPVADPSETRQLLPVAATLQNPTRAQEFSVGKAANGSYSIWIPNDDPPPRGPGACTDLSVSIPP